MDINKLKTFVDLAETRSFSQTAVNLYIGQSSVSKHIKALEKEINHPLFIRNNKKTELSEYGKIMYPYAQQIIKASHQMEDEFSQLNKIQKNSITIGVIPTLAKYSAFNQIMSYMEDHLEITINLREVETCKLWEQLQNNQIDIAFVRIFDKVNKDYESIITQKEKFNLWVSKNNPLSKRKKVNIKELKDENFVLLPKGSLLMQPVVGLCKEAGFSPKIIFTSYRLSSLEEIIADNQAISIEMGKPQLKSKVKAVSITPSKTCKLAFLRKNSKRTKAIDNFWKYLGKMNNSKSE